MFKTTKSARARSFLIASLVLAPVMGMSAAAPASAYAPTVADIARSQVGNDCTPYYGCVYPSAWCAEFSRWVWKQAGANTSGLNAAAASFYSYGQRNGTLHTSGPQIGDAVLWDDDGSVSGEANHVSLVVGVSDDGSQIQTVGGNESRKVSYKNWFNWRTYTNPGAGKALAFVSPVGVPGTPPPTTTPPAPTGQWRAQVAVESGGGLFHAVRNPDRTWTGFGNVENVAGEVPGGVRTSAEAGIDGTTHVLAVNNEGKLYHTVRLADGNWAGFGDVHGEAGPLANITQVAAVSSGTELQVVVVADGKVYHTVRRANGTWAPFGAVGNPGGAPVTKVAMSQTGSDTQIVALSGGSLFHTVRHADGTWIDWGNASTETGVSGIGDIAVAGTGGDMQLVVTTEGGAKRYHGARFASGQWVLNDLSSVVPAGITVTDVAAAAVNNELQAAFVTTDGRVLHTIRAVNGTWTPAAPVDLTGVTGNHTGVSITGTYN
ncbi:CHAP domain-containing protein [Streptomyces sp. NBC_00249]|uniref:CHAP domain-containing protein n=1 Tax=Streptomyces sp. NBC_00249 TaxID=2975690 RepID=UPI00225B5FAE|nr:CHAP domain-containing protein [Streptomyces sp. NBC_00249]MCX5194275.1 CHAP domain-containing protein [Streptomyces sp. NBC_00249]